MMTTAQLAVALACTEQTVSQYAKHGKIPGAVKVGNKWRFPDDVIERMAAAQANPHLPRPRKRRAA